MTDPTADRVFDSMQAIENLAHSDPLAILKLNGEIVRVGDHYALLTSEPSEPASSRAIRCNFTLSYLAPRNP